MTTAGAHALTFSKTNSYAIVPVCACGWVGSVHPSYRKTSGDGRRGKRDYQHARNAAGIEHGRHMLDARPLTVTLAPEQFVPIVLNTSRFGHA